MIIIRALFFSVLWLTILWQPTGSANAWTMVGVIHDGPRSRSVIPLDGGPMWEPMAIAIIFGLIFATLLTLGVVPVLYSLFYRVDFRATGPNPAFQ